MKFNLNPKLSPKAKKYIGRVISQEMKAGRKQIQAIAMAYAKARKKGFQIPKKAKKRNPYLAETQLPHGPMYGPHASKGWAEIQRFDDKDKAKADQWLRTQNFFQPFYRHRIVKTREPKKNPGLLEGVASAALVMNTLGNLPRRNPPVQCPHCGSINVAPPPSGRMIPMYDKYGVSQKRAKYRCKDCLTFFTGEEKPSEYGRQYPSRRSNPMLPLTQGECWNCKTYGQIMRDSKGRLKCKACGVTGSPEDFGLVGDREKGPKARYYGNRRSSRMNYFNPKRRSRPISGPGQKVYEEEGACGYCGSTDYTELPPVRGPYGGKVPWKKCNNCGEEDVLMTKRNPNDVNDLYKDDENLIACPTCGGYGVYMGSLGNREHFRCRQCGMDFSKRAVREEEVSDEARSYGPHWRSRMGRRRGNPSSPRRRTGYTTAAKEFISRYISRHTPKSGKLTPKQRGTLLSQAVSKARSKGLITKRKSSSATRHTTHTRTSRRSVTPSSPARRSSIYSRSRTTGGRSLVKPVKIYDKIENKTKLYVRGSANSGSHGITKSTGFVHRVTSAPSIYGIPKSGLMRVHSGDLLIHGKKRLFGRFGSSKSSKGGSK